MIDELKKLEASLREALPAIERERFKKIDVEGEIEVLKERKAKLKDEVDILSKTKSVAEDEVKKEKAGIYASIDAMVQETKDKLKEAKNKLSDVESAERSAESGKRSYELQSQSLVKTQAQVDKLVATCKEKLDKAETLYTLLK